MTKEEAIKYLQQLYPNGGHCWLDEQRIQAIGMSVKALQEEPVSTKDKLLALSDGKLHLGWIDDAKVVEFEECLMQFHEDMNNIPQGTDSLTRLKDTDGVLHSYSKKLMSMAKEEPVSEELEEASKEWLKPQLDKSYANYGEAKMMELTHFDGYAMLDAIEFGAQWQKAKDESTTEDLSEYINKLSKQFPEVSFAKLSRIAVRVVKWQKEKLWKSAEGPDLPIFDREVIALIDNGKVVFAHRPDPKGWDAKSIITEKVEHYTPETYGKGGWNQPNVKWWLDVDILPKED